MSTGRLRAELGIVKVVANRQKVHIFGFDGELRDAGCWLLPSEAPQLVTQINERKYSWLLMWLSLVLAVSSLGHAVVRVFG